MPSYVVWSVLVCWTKTEWSLITYWVLKLKISWKGVSKPKCLNLVWLNQFIMQEFWSGSATSGNIQYFLIRFLKGHLVWPCVNLRLEIDHKGHLVRLYVDLRLEIAHWGRLFWPTPNDAKQSCSDLTKRGNNQWIIILFRFTHLVLICRFEISHTVRASES